MGYDCYCALCGVILGSFVRFGVRSPTALRQRRRRVDRKRRRLAGEPDVHEDLTDGESSEEESAKALETTSGYDEKMCYDPEVLDERDVKWLGNCRCLGFNAEAEGVTKAFVSLKGIYDDNGSFRVRQNRAQVPNPDPNDPGADRLTCYLAYDADETPAFPFHETCYKILARCILGHSDTKSINKDAMYSAMAQMCGTSTGNDRNRTLGLDYGSIEGIDQFWECYPGEEYAACNPGLKDQMYELVLDGLPPQLFNKSSSTPDLSAKVRNDPFSKLPYDILVVVFPYVQFDQILALMKASWYINTQTRSAQFWNWMIRTRILPWFSEIEDLVTNAKFLDEDSVTKRFFLWLSHITTPKFAMTGPFMGIANRRRIWNACQQLVPLYLDRMPKSRTNLDDDPVAKEIWNSAVSLYMPIVYFPTPQTTHPASVQWIRSWDDVQAKNRVFEASWNHAGALVDLGVRFGADCRRLGTSDCIPRGVRTEVRHLADDEWIQEIVVHLKDADMFSEPPKRSETGWIPQKPAFAVALTIVLSSGESLIYGNPTEHLNRRALITSPGFHIVGLIGEVASEGPITRLGLLQAQPPGTVDRGRPALPPLSTLLWHASSSEVPYAGEHDSTIPIWQHPTLRKLPTPHYGQHFDVPMAMLPHHILLWASSTSELKTLRQISVNQVFGGLINRGHPTNEYPKYDIIGMRVEHSPTKATEEPIFRTIGSGGPIPNDSPEWEPRVRKADTLALVSPQRRLNHPPWDPDALSHFLIDGASGEIITEVHVSDSAKSLKLRTNTGREVEFGRRHNNVTVQRAGEGEAIVGLVVCFGTLHGGHYGEKTSHYSTTTITAVVMPIDEGGLLE